MKVLWAPWRLSYVSAPDAKSGCIFCDKPGLTDAAQRRQALVLYSDASVSIMLNRYPYSNAHLMVAPRTHSADLGAMTAEQSGPILEQVSRCVRILDSACSPAGFNIGANLGLAAGAGIADHLHWHVVPRWEGDTNFMPVLGDVKVMPEHLEATYDKLYPMFQENQS